MTKVFGEKMGKHRAIFAGVEMLDDPRIGMRDHEDN